MNVTCTEKMLNIHLKRTQTKTCLHNYFVIYQFVRYFMPFFHSYKLMCSCWSYDPEDRQTFAYILHQLQRFHDACMSMEYLVPVRSNNRPLATGEANLLEIVNHVACLI